MPLKLDRRDAAAVVRAEFTAGEAEDAVDPLWRSRVERLSALCEEGTASTHIAFLGTAILARCVNPKADLAAIKPKHAKDNPFSWSARSLCHGVLVPLAAELNINLGVTGREPLNNQPYFRMTRLDDETPVHAGSRLAFDYMRELVRELERDRSEGSAKAALRAFLFVRRVRRSATPAISDLTGLTPQALLEAIEGFVGGTSSGGRRAQAVVAGLISVVYGATRVECGRINDPSRRQPGDVAVVAKDGHGWEKVFEVRDKPVSSADLEIFARKAHRLGAREAAMVAVSPGQERLPTAPCERWAEQEGLGLTVFVGWADLVAQALFWAPAPAPDAARQAAAEIHTRLLQIELPPAEIASWPPAHSPARARAAVDS